MRDFSKVSPALWRSKKFRALKSDDARMIYIYLLTCPHGNSAGCFDIHPGYASADLDMVAKRYQDGIAALCNVGLIEVDEAENTVLITNWLEFNAPANPKHALGILSQLEQASSERLKASRFQELAVLIKAKKFDRETSIRNAIEVFFERYRNGIATETETEMETKTETRPDQTETETREEGSRPAHRAPATLTGGTLAPVEQYDPTSPPRGMPKPLTAAEQGAASRLLSTNIMRRVS